MKESNPPNRWSMLNEVAVIEAMLKDANSEHWSTCHAFVQYIIKKHFPDLTAQEDAAQEAMLSVHKNLSAFRQDCKLTTWLTKVARSRALDEVRRIQGVLKWEVQPENLAEGHEDDSERFMISTKTPEEVVLTIEQRQEMNAVIEEFLKLHPRKQNREILKMVLEDGNRYEKAAQILGVPAANIGYIVRLAREYLKQKVLHPSDENE